MRRSIATVCLSGTLEDKLAAAAAAGFDEVELFEPDLVAAPHAPAEVRRRAAELGLEIGLYQPFRDFEAVPEERFAANLRRAERKFAVMERLGADLLLVCSNVSERRSTTTRSPPRSSACSPSAPPSTASGSPTRRSRGAATCATTTTRGGSSRPADHPALGICLDSFHILSRGADPRGIRDIPGEKIFFLQLADAPHLVMDVLQWSRHYRCFPGQGGFDLPAFLAHVLAAGYAGPLSLEVFNDVFRQADPRRMAVDAMRSLLLLEEAAGRRRCRRPRSCAATRSSSSRSRREARRRRRAAADRAGLPPRRAAPHQGRAAVAARATPASWSTTSTRRRPGPRVAAIAVESADSDPLGRARRAPARARCCRAIAGPARRTCRRSRRPTARRCSSAAPTPPTPTAGSPTSSPPARPGPGATAELAGIDHVALSQPFDYFDEAALFYRSVLGLELQAGAELAAPEGLVRSRAARSADGSVRFALSVPVVGSGGSELQHVAFACGDIFAAARAMRDRGVPLLADPRQLLRRPRRQDRRSSRQLIERMRELGVLYDAGEAAASSCTSTPRMIGPEPLLRGASSAAAATTATAPPTRPCGWPRSRRR